MNIYKIVLAVVEPRLDDLQVYDREKKLYKFAKCLQINAPHFSEGECELL
jgi:hypothetical protein